MSTLLRPYFTAHADGTDQLNLPIPNTNLHDESRTRIRSYSTEASPEVWLEMYRNRTKSHLQDIDCKPKGIIELRSKCWKPRVPCLGGIILDPVLHIYSSVQDGNLPIPNTNLHDESRTRIRSYSTEASPEVWLEMYRNRTKSHLHDIDCKPKGMIELRSKCWKPRVPCLGGIILDPVLHIYSSVQDGNEYKYFCNLGLIKRLTNSRPLIYSLGSNNDWNFEEFMYDFFDQNAEIYTFSIEKVGPSKPHWLRYHQVAIGTEKNITQLHEELGYAGKPIHILKIDIEGFEQLLLADLFGPDGKTCMLEIWHFSMEMHWDINYWMGGYPNFPYKLELQAQHEKQLSEVCGLEKVSQHGYLGLSENTYINIDWKDVLKQIGNLNKRKS
ncbi:unnamed protein product [Cyprideis torosa]|uniref:Methyltransferase domain-containing protein n=1 Tax=Cyprideis torosa TaxID=163714 RepID=A0A7R8W3D2_9CRUS|nr:unnamed protein product [Cyprideis torosa]CAG0882867.1 unnamed protein product [Cyprideis torosa]